MHSVGRFLVSLLSRYVYKQVSEEAIKLKMFYDLQVPRTNKKRQVNPTDTDKLQRLFEEASSNSSTQGGSSVHDFEESERSADEQDGFPSADRGMLKDGSNSPAHDPYSDTADMSLIVNIIQLKTK